jgi:hypothetical protein
VVLSVEPSLKSTIVNSTIVPEDFNEKLRAESYKNSDKLRAEFLVSLKSKTDELSKII